MRVQYVSHGTENIFKKRKEKKEKKKNRIDVKTNKYVEKKGKTEKMELYVHSATNEISC